MKEYRFEIGPQGMQEVASVVEFGERLPKLLKWGYYDLSLEVTDGGGIAIVAKADTECLCGEEMSEVLVCGNGLRDDTAYLQFMGYRCPTCYGR